MSFAGQPELPEPLILAARSGDLKQVAELIVGQNCSADYLQKGLYEAAEYGQVAAARCLLDHGAMIAHTSYAAARGGSIQMLELFLEYGWNVTDPGQGNSILPQAIRAQSHAVVKWLLGKGVDPNLGKPNFGLSLSDRKSGEALDAAASKSTPDIFNLLLNYGSRIEDSNPLHSAAASNNEDAERISMMTYLLQFGLDIDSFDAIKVAYSRGTALWWAVNCRMVVRARFLLDHGANPYLAKGRHRSPYNEAKRIGFTAFIEICPVPEEQPGG